jgi:microcompartment protein CcmK/EutM
MILGMVVGTVVSERRGDQIEAPRYLLVEQCDQTGAGQNDFLVAIDMIGANSGELVMIGQGSAARQTEVTYDRPIDAVIVGIIDLIDEHGKEVYRK